MDTLYHKIETPFKRDIDGTRKLIEGSFRDSTVEFLKDCQWVWKEKIDGTNIRIIWDGYKVSIRGRTDKANLPVDLLDKLFSYFAVPEAEELFEQMFGEKEVVIYGEGYGAGIQEVGKDYLDHKDFIAFDVRVGDCYLAYDDVKKIATCFGVKTVPVVLTGTLNDAVTLIKTHPKSLEGDCIMEGVVGSPAISLKDTLGRRVIVKVKCRDF